jgi:hypothetical protein
MTDVRMLFRSVLAEIDVAHTLQRVDIVSALKSVSRAAEELGVTIDELTFELIAANLVLYDEANRWGTRFGPAWSCISDDGERVDIPSLSEISRECLGYWSDRSKSVLQPVLRARYADFVWDFSSKLDEERPSVEAVQIAINGYVEAIVDDRCEPVSDFGNVLNRALELATSIDDDKQWHGTLARLVQHALRDASGYRQQKLLMALPHNGRAGAALQSLADDLHIRFNELCANQADAFVVQDVAFSLADYYRLIDRAEEARSVLRLYRNAVVREAEEATVGVFELGGLRKLCEFYERNGMHDESQVLQPIMSGLSAKVRDFAARHSRRGRNADST